MNIASKGLFLLALCAGLGCSAASAHDFTGGYVGLNIGGNAAYGKASTTTVFTPTGYFAASSIPAIAAAGNQSLNTTGFNFGAQAGYNWSIGGNWLLGVEADFGTNSDTAKMSSAGVYPCCAPTSFAVNSKVSTSWLLTVRPKLAWTWNDGMVYATGGLAMTDEKAAFLFTDTFATANESGVFTKTNTGWTIGAGLEEAWTDTWSWKVEYLHASFGGVGGTSTNLTAFGPPTIAFPANIFTHHASLQENILRFGINYHL